VTEQAPAPGGLAEEMFAEAQRDGQSARSVVDDVDAEEVREALRRLGRTSGVRLRTARMGPTVVVARADAQLWRDDQATMRAKLTPPG
jgi:hypothetical protein